LGYITPVQKYVTLIEYNSCLNYFFFLQWNNHGYDVAKIFTNKFNLISPVWLQVTPTPGGKGYVVTGALKYPNSNSIMYTVFHI